ncbi:hypothetical protein QBC39DRAFT_174779 [Podospora conica]|nr:hypothetical protein QBC39DRAFT_174779 [Schizothecium conicum]
MAPHHLHRWLLAAAAAAMSLSTVSAVSATNVSVRWMPDLPEWQTKALMRLQLTAPSAEAAPLSYDVYPLAALLANGTQMTRNTVRITGNIAIAEPETYELINRTDSIAYVSCDREDANQIVNDVLTMRANLKAILLFSLKGDCCGLQGLDIPFDDIYTMGNAGEALETLNTTSSAEGVVRASIIGNWTMGPDENVQSQGGSNSAVAMSILYSITGLITLLFLVIIATGAIRAHRYPERYGPRSGYGGRPRQSRAKGLARAVLETLPIVKFGESAPAKPDPALELESQTSRHSPDPSARARLSAIPEEPRTPMIQLGNTTPKPETIPEAAVAATAAPLSAIGSGIRHGPNDEHLGCSICTEDFSVGEDVRVLPCDHKFHPPCIDPWLINVSGTCPLCRLDLRPEKTADGGPDEPPPLAADFDDASSARGDRRRSSTPRILDLHRLRHASVEERIEILRRHRSQQQEQVSAEPESEEQRGRRARLADRLRDTFRVRTRTQSPRDGRGTPDEGR